ncbi:MAG: DegT/DnrJ/EryC1/StrS aminotransferase family protein [Spirochaetaceae bacterium]|nr:DegT/DnrJ/EryC1/StrS aminotransferase family protein [Spirochaetaceae bacterium]
MIQTYSSTIRRKEMDAVLTCMVDEKIGPGEMNVRLTQVVKEFLNIDGCVAFRSPNIALKYALEAIDLPLESGVMISALAPIWQFQTIMALGYKPILLDVSVDTALVFQESVEQGIKNGGRLLLLTHTMGNIPDMDSLLAFGIPIIEDISQSLGAFRHLPPKEDTDEVEIQKAGTMGVYSIMGLEERDIVTGGGGAVLIAPSRREWIVLKHLVEKAPSTDILPDLNSALAFVQLKEFNRNHQIRQDIFEAFQKALMSSRHKTFLRTQNGVSAAYTFPVLLNSGFKDVKQYAARKGVEIGYAFENSVAEYLKEELADCVNAKSLLLRTANFPLYPRLGNSQVSSIIKVLGTLP